MLFKGAKAVMGHQEHQGANGKEKEFTLHELPTGQTTIGRDGKLHKSKQLSQIPPTGVSKACSFCVRSVIEKEVCSQCERSVCKDCCKPCSCCSAITCSFCTVSVDGNDGDQMFCSTCAVFEA